MTAKQVSCPRCGTQVLFSPDNPWRPFCSERCRAIDLGAWATEAYRVPVSPESDGDAVPDTDEQDK